VARIQDVPLPPPLVEVECLRALDRLRLREGLTPEELVVRREAVYRLTAEMEVVEPTWPVLCRANQPFPTPLGTLDAVHPGHGSPVARLPR
jgi:hypothetical protein